MSTTEKVQSETSLKELLLKINHPILDVRCRSLDSILFKLKNGLLCTSSLALEAEFLSHLLEWFNFEEWASEMQVLLLLTQLSKHKEAASALVDLGGVEFLSQLRLHCNESLHSLIDEVLEQLLQQPFTNPPPPVAAGQLPSVEVGPDEAAQTDLAMLCSSSNSATCTFKSELTSDDGSYWHQNGHAHHQNGHASQTQLSNSALPLICRPGLVHRASQDSRHNVCLQETSCSDADGGSLVGHDPRKAQQRKKEKLQESFPWLSLTENDHQVLSTTESRLEFPSSESLVHSSNFLQDVLFQDFPPEVFLQRPTILSRLLWLLTSADWSSTHLPCLTCLLSYAQRLRSRVKLAHYPYSLALDYSGSHSPDSSDPSLQCHYNPLSRDPVAGFQSKEEELGGRRDNQYSVSSFCSSVISNVAPILVDHLDRDFPWASSSSSGNTRELSLPVFAAGFAGKCLQLLEVAVDMLELEVQRCRLSSVRVEDIEKIMMDSISSLSSTANRCLSKWRTLLPKKPRLSQVQLVACVTLSVCAFISRILQQAVQFNMLDQQQLQSMTVLTSVLEDFIQNGSFSIVCRDVQNSFCSVLKMTNQSSSAAQAYETMKLFSEAFQSKFRFLKSSTDTEATPKNELVQLALAALPGLWFYCDDAFVEKAVALSLFCTCRRDGKGGEKWNMAKSLLLKLLNHGEPQIQNKAFLHFINLLSKSLCLRSSSHLSSSVLASKDSTEASNTPRFWSTLENPEIVLLDQDLLHLLVVEGTVSRSGMVSSLCQELLGDVLSLRGKVYWPQLRDHLLPYLPYLEVVVADNDHLFQELKALLCQSGEVPVLVQLSSLLRLLYSASDQVRDWSWKCLSDLFTKPGSKAFITSSEMLSLPCGVLLNGQSDRAFSVGLATLRDGDFKHEDVVKLFNISKSGSLSLALRKSALEQLVLLLQDRCLHIKALSDGLLSDLVQLLERTLTHLKEVRQSGHPDNAHRDYVGLLTSALKCVWVLSAYSSGVRSSLSEDYHNIALFFQASVLCPKEAEITSIVSRLLFLLLFAKVVNISEDVKISLPSPIHSRLRLPFEVSGFDVNSGFDIEMDHSPLENHSCSTTRFASQLKVLYLYSCAGNIGEIFTLQEELNSEEVDPKLALNESEATSLRCMDLNRSIVDFYESLSTATSHGSIVEILQHMLVVIFAGHQIAAKGTEIDFSIARRKSIGVLDRFLNCTPTTLQDKSLLISVLSFYKDIILLSKNGLAATSQASFVVTSEELNWVVDIFLGPNSVALQFLKSLLEEEHSEEGETVVNRQQQKSILQFYTSIIRQLSQSIHTSQIKKFSPVPLMNCLYMCLKIAGSPDFKDIPLLEVTLNCLLRIVDKELLDEVPSSLLGLSMKILSSLRQILWSFLSGEGQMEKSFMGKGVVCKASMAMANLAFSVSRQQQCPKEWWHQWIQSSSVGLAWLQRLLEDRNPEARSTAFILLASLVSQPDVTSLMMTTFSQFNPFGLWGICFAAALDVNENSFVQKQAFSALNGLCEVCIKDKQWSHYLNCTTSEISVSGEEALVLLLDYYLLSEVLLSVLHPESINQYSSRISGVVQPFLKGELILSILAPTSEYPGSQQRTENFSSEAGRDEGSLRATLVETMDAFNPHFVSGACGFFHNVFIAYPKYINKYLRNGLLIVNLIRLLDPVFIGSVLVAQSDGIISAALGTCWIEMYCKIVLLVHGVFCISLDVIEVSEKLVETLTKNITLCYEFMERCKHGIELASAILSLLWTLVCSKDWRNIVYTSIEKYWDSFTGLLIFSLKDQLNMRLRLFSLQLLHSVISKQTQLMKISKNHKLSLEPARQFSAASSSKSLKLLLDGDGTVEVTNCCGGILCASLLKAKDCESSGRSVPEDKELSCLQEKLAQDVLSVLLAVSTSAKQVALSSGLLELTFDQLKTTHAKLCAEVLDHPVVSKGKKVNVLVNQLKAHLKLLRNFMYESETVKASCLKENLTSIIHKIWPSCTIYTSLLQSSLDLLSVFTAHYPPGQASLTASSKGSSSLLQDVLKHTSHSLSSYYSCVSAKLPNPHADTVGPLFSLLANSALSSECRSVFKKSTFLNGFAQVQPRNEKNASLASHQVRISSLWLQLLVNLSFSVDGIALITKAEGMVETLLDVHGCGILNDQMMCLMIFRNFSFHGPGRTLIASDEGIMNVMLSSLESSHPIKVTVAASALWAIIHYSSKMRTSLKRSGLRDKLSSAHAKMKRLGSTELTENLWYEKCFEAQEQAMQLL